MDQEELIEDILMDDDETQQFNWEFKPPYHKFFLAIIRSFGWYIIGVSVILIYLWPRLNKIWSSWKKSKDDSEYDAKYHKDVDMNSKLLLATQLARERMQEKYLKEREIALKKEQERQERKREEAMRLLNNGSSGYRLNGDLPGDSQPSSSKANKYKGDYNPLAGDGSSGRYRPPKRSGCGKGGCG